MDYRNLGHTGLKVSELCLGTMQWGWTAGEDAAVEVMDAFVAAGGNFIDTADVYSRWAEGNPGGVSEEIIGRWMKSRGNRDQVVLATKVRARMWDGPNGEGLSKVHIVKACEDSLRRLQTDYIDLYQTHFFDADTPIEETMETLDLLVRQGKVRYVGCSNYPAWRLTHALWASDKRGWVRYDSLQPHYNLVHRGEFERELRDVCTHFGLGVIPYSPLAGGFLTGKYRRSGAAESAAGRERAQPLYERQGLRRPRCARRSGCRAQCHCAPGRACLAAPPGLRHRAHHRRQHRRAARGKPGCLCRRPHHGRNGTVEPGQQLGVAGPTSRRFPHLREVVTARDGAHTYRG